MNEDSFTEDGDEYSDGDGEMEEEGEGEIAIPAPPKFEELGFISEEEYKKVVEEFQFFDKKLDGSIAVSDTEKLIRILLSTKNKIYFDCLPKEKSEEPIIDEIPKEMEKTEEFQPNEEEMGEEDEEVGEEPEETITVDEFCLMFNKLRKIKSLNHAQNEFQKALSFFDDENNKIIGINEMMKSISQFEEMIPEETENVNMTDFLEKLKAFEFLTQKIVGENEKKEKLEEMKKFYFEDYMKDIPSSSSSSEEEESGEDEDEKLSAEEKQKLEKRKAKLFKSHFYLDYTFIPKKNNKEHRKLCIKIENSLATRISGNEEMTYKALDETKQKMIFDFLDECDFFNEERFLGERPDVTLEANHFIFRNPNKRVEMMILKDFKLFNSQLDDFICSFL